MTWFERGLSRGTVSLAGLLNGDPLPSDVASSSLAHVVDNVLGSGFPGLAPLSITQQRLLLDGYLDEIARADMPRLSDIRHQPGTLRRLLTSVGRMTGSELRHATLAADVATTAPGIRNETIASYVELLERLFVVELVPAFATALRSRAKLRTSPKVHLADPALAAAALSADADALIADPNTLGFLFESAVVHDLTVMAEAQGGHVDHHDPALRAGDVDRRRGVVRALATRPHPSRAPVPCGPWIHALLPAALPVFSCSRHAPSCLRLRRMPAPRP